MKPTLLTLPFLLASLCLSAWADSVEVLPASGPRRSELRDAVDAHRAASRDEVRREEAAAGRHLTPAELAELREQVRRQWMPRSQVVQSAESQPAERMVPNPMMGGGTLPGQRP
ncbi:hypothetical protein [Variovorax sp. PBL-E5]|uniref:hypothetical protein n=1 Tax=Variovorax sp. PBL-E5 TaxID=434014 RepID=UPI0013166E4A|nr:hypothetical protein [Variovorax sp. PBL-E5]VTU27666.1 hypothetical protein E5CHR_02450 [Variovorax sp. PBL-E5]